MGRFIFLYYFGKAQSNQRPSGGLRDGTPFWCRPPVPPQTVSYTHLSQSELCGSVFKIEYTDRKQRLAYLRLYSGTLHLRDTIILSEKKKMKLTEMYIPSNGEMIQTEIACSGDIVILPNDTLKLNDIVGNEKMLPCNAWNDNPVPMQMCIRDSLCMGRQLPVHFL